MYVNLIHKLLRWVDKSLLFSFNFTANATSTIQNECYENNVKMGIKSHINLNTYTNFIHNRMTQAHKRKREA